MANTSILSLMPGNREWMQKNDILVGIGVISIVVMLIIPLPTFLLDFLITISLMIGLLILMIVMFVHRSDDFSIFPSLILITTVFRLALNVSSTRLILLQGASFDGKIIKAFGQFVVGGNYVVGFIIFIILIAVQFIVITKGATRTAEVAARFTLDALPGKQMSIDADFQNGVITEAVAQERRAEIRKEADFYGAMDGASKFVSGDVKVGIIIVFINLIGGFIIGMVQRGESFELALRTYSLLTIGDGLVNQIPSLLTTTATGIIVTRAVSKGNFGDQLGEQLTSEPKALYITAGALAVGVFVPGFPKIALIVLSAGIAFLGYVLTKSREEELESKKHEAKQQSVKDTRPESVLPPPVDILAIEIGYNLIPLADPDQGGTLLGRITNLRRRSVLEMGLIVPPIRIRDNMELEPEMYSILIRGVEVGRGMLQVGKFMAIDSGNVKEKIDEGVEFVEPVYNLNAKWIDPEIKDLAASRGYDVNDCPSIIATHMTEIIKRHADEILGREEVKKLIDNIRNDYPAVVEEIERENRMQLGEIQKVLQNLLRERVSIINMVTILETLATYSSRTKDPGLLTEYVRAALARQITGSYTTRDNVLSVIGVAPEIENIIIDSIYEDENGKVLGLDQENYKIIINALLDAYKRSINMKFIPPIFVVSPQIRSIIFTLLEREIQAPVVLAHNEISKNINMNVVAYAAIS